MIKQICSGCGKSWKEYGMQWKRTNSNRIDYRCGNCGCKRTPTKLKDNNNILDELESGIWPTYLKDLKKVINKKQYENILLVGDLHLPFTIEDGLDFCTEIYHKYNCDHVIFMGDLIDNHFSSFHATDPDGMSAKDELDYAINELQKWSEVFPKADVCIGNHDLLILRQMYKNGVSKRWVKDFDEVLGVNWNFQTSFEYNDCLFRHGEGLKAAPKSNSEMMNVIQSHYHIESYITWSVGRGKKVFGMQVPCLVNRESYAMAYAKDYPKQAIGCAVLLEFGRLPIIEMCDL